MAHVPDAVGIAVTLIVRGEAHVGRLLTGIQVQSRHAEGVRRHVADLKLIDNDSAGDHGLQNQIVVGNFQLAESEMRKVEVDIDFIGITVPNAFLIGYGLDYEQKFRLLNDIRNLS